MSLLIRKANPSLLLKHLLDKQCCFDKPFLLAIDCDRTIVDRKSGAHFIRDEVVQMFHKLRQDSRFIVTINTGRDLTNYQPIQTKLSHSQPCIFLSGRVLCYSDRIITLPKATIPQSFCSNVWQQFIAGSIPFLDTKHEKGNTYFGLKHRNMKKYYGLYKPIDWFDLIECIESDQEQDFRSLKIVRFEIPFLKQENQKIVEAIERNDKDKIQQSALDFFGTDYSDRLQFIPLHINPSRKGLCSDVAFLRVIVNGKDVNKGTGLKAMMKNLSIPESNLICFGDSAEETASDSIIKQVLPQATLLIMEDGDPHAIKDADFLIKGVNQNGVPEAISYLTEALNNFHNTALSLA